jgi:hypothetical protein
VATPDIENDRLEQIKVKAAKVGWSAPVFGMKLL